MKKKQNKAISFSEYAFLAILGLLWSKEVICEYLRVFLTKLFFNSDLWGYGALNFLFILLLFVAIPYITKHVKVRDCLFCFAFLTIYLVQKNLKLQNYEYLTQKELTVLFVNLPFFLLGTCFGNNRFNYLKHVSRLSIIVFTLYILTLGASKIGEDNMTYSYSVLPHAVLIVFSFFRKKNFSDLFLLFISGLMILVLGTRGPLLLLLLALLSNIVIFDNCKLRWKVVRVILLALLGLSLIIFYENVLSLFRDIAVNMGFSTRIIEYLNNKAFFESIGRNEIYELIIPYLRKMPFFGYGLAGDRFIAYDIAYSHNLAIEVIITFGYFIGTILLSLLAILIVRAIIIGKKDQNLPLLLTVLFSNGFLKLFLSSSFLLEPFFFLLIGCSIFIIRSNAPKLKQKTGPLLVCKEFANAQH